MPIWNEAVEGIEVRGPEDLDAIERTPFDEVTDVRSVYELLGRQAAERPDWPAIVFMPTADPDGPTVTLTYCELFARVTRAANLFHALSEGAPPVVALMLPSLPDAHVALWAGAAAGVAMPLNFLLRPDDLAALVETAGATVLVALGPQPGLDIWEKALAVRERVPTLRALVQVGGVPAERELAFETALAEQPDDHLVSGRTFARGDIAAYFHTGGTTGLPRLACHSNENHLAMAFGVGRTWAFEPGEGVMNGLPIFHVGGALDVGLAPLAAGAFMLLVTPTGLRNPGVVKNVWRIAAKFRLGVVGGVPTSIVAMLRTPVGDADISSVRIAITGGSPLPLEPARQFEERFGIGVHEVYGMTETCGNGVVTPRHTRRVPGSSGLRTPYTQVKTARLKPDGTLGEDCLPDEPGVILMRGPTVTPGYTDPALDEGVRVADGWLSTGDLGRVTAEGRVFITGRAKDVIIRSGHNIDPALIEGAADAHPDVLHSAAVGMPDEYAGELPALFVSARPGAELSVEALHDWLRARIAEQPALPKRIEVLAELPLTAVGKIYKPALRARLIESVFAARLDDIGVDVEVEAVVRPGQGIVATVTCRGEADRAAVEAVVSERLAGFSLYAHEARWDA